MMKIITKIGLSLFVACAMASTAVADEGEPMQAAAKSAPVKEAPATSAPADMSSDSSESIADGIDAAFAAGEVSGTIGTYFEIVDVDVPASNRNYATGYLNLKYETAKYKGVKMGVAFMAHTELDANADNGSNPWDADMEEQYTVPELYISADFLNESNVLVGRYDHRKISHIDDSHSEGAYVMFNELEAIDLTLGMMQRYAEIDYDDNEDFGRTNKSQDLSDEATYGADAKEYLLFLEGKMKPCDMLKLNPYIMYQDGYAAVYGIDAKVSKKLENMTVGAKIGYHHVAADVAGLDDADNFALFPYIKAGDLKVIVGYAKFDDGNAMNRPNWVAETYSVMDQQAMYGAAGTEAYFAKAKYVVTDRIWVHGAIAKKSYDYTMAAGDEVIEYELQAGLKLTNACDLNIRLFDVQYDNVNDMDYQKLEGRLRYKF